MTDNVQIFRNVLKKEMLSRVKSWLKEQQFISGTMNGGKAIDRDQLCNSGSTKMDMIFIQHGIMTVGKLSKNTLIFLLNWKMNLNLN